MLPTTPLMTVPVRNLVKAYYVNFGGGASAASEATLSSCPLRFAIYVIVSIIVRASQACGDS